MRPFLSILLALGASTALAQSTRPEDPIATSRPSISDTPGIVPVRHLQIESGLSGFARGGGPEYAQFGEALLRYGLRPNVEVRLGLPNYLVLAHGSPAGFDDTSVAASLYLGRVAGLDVGVVPTLSFPTGARGLRDEAVTPSFSLNVAHDMGGGRSLGGTLAQSYGRQGGHDLTQTLATLVYVQPLGALTAFAEVAGTFAPLDRPEQYAHVGLQRLVTRTAQVDLHVGLGLDKKAAHEFVGAGLSVRF